MRTPVEFQHINISIRNVRKNDPLFSTRGEGRRELTNLAPGVSPYWPRSYIIGKRDSTDGWIAFTNGETRPLTFETREFARFKQDMA